MAIHDRPTVSVEQVQEFDGKLLRAAALLIRGASPNELQALIVSDLIEQQLRNIPFYRVWETVKVGEMTKKAMVKSLEQDGYFIRDNARDLIESHHFALSPGRTEVPLARAKVKALLRASGSLQQQHDRGYGGAPISLAIEEIGASPPPLEVVLRLKISDAYGNRLVWIPSDMTAKHGGNRFWFYLFRDADSRPWIGAQDPYSAFFWNERGEDEVLFIPRKLT